MVHLACEAPTDPQSVALSTELRDHEWASSAAPDCFGDSRPLKSVAVESIQHGVKSAVTGGCSTYFDPVGEWYYGRKRRMLTCLAVLWCQQSMPLEHPPQALSRRPYGRGSWRMRGTLPLL